MTSMMSGLSNQLSSAGAQMPQAQQQQMQQQQQPSAMQSTMGGGGGAGGMPSMPTLPSTGLSQQLASLSQMKQAGQQYGTGAATQASNIGIQQQGGMAGTSLNQLASTLANQYGLSLPRGPIIDAQGNFMYTPDQIAEASGGAETMGSAAAKMNYISAAIAKRQNMQNMAKARASAETGLGQVQSRGRGSLAALQSGLYSNLANLYASEQHDAADFSYFIQKEYLDIQQDIMRKQEKLAKKQARGAFIGGIGMGVLGVATGNWGMVGSGVQASASSAGGTGWF